MGFKFNINLDRHACINVNNVGNKNMLNIIVVMDSVAKGSIKLS